MLERRFLCSSHCSAACSNYTDSKRVTHTVRAEEDSSRYRTIPCFHQPSQSVQPVYAALSHQRHCELVSQAAVSHAAVLCALSEPFGELQRCK